AVIQVSHTLVVFLAFLEDKHAHGFAGQDNRFQGVRQLVDIENFHALQLGDFVQVEVVGDDLGLVHFGQFYQFEVDFADGRKIVFDDLYVDGDDLLQALQDVQPAPSPVALEGIGRIGDQLQLAQNELRNHHHSVQKAGVGDIGNAPVDDDAGVKDL